jgi:hypothetical protein
MISNIRRSQPKVPTVHQAPAQRKTAAQVKDVRQSVSRFEAAGARVKATGQRDGRVAAARRELTKNLWALRKELRAQNAPAVFEEAKRLATTLGVPLSSKANTADRVLTLIGKQLIGPGFIFTSMRDFRRIVEAWSARVPPGRINAPDPSGRRC